MEFGAEEEEEEEDNLQRSEIETYIRSIGLNTGTNGERVGVGGAEDKAGEKERKQTLEKKIGKEVNKRAKKEKKDVGDTKRQQEPQITAEPKNKKEKKKSKNKKMSKLTDGEGGPGRPSEKKEVEKRLLCLSISPQTTKLLVSPDSQETWFEQSASTEAAFPVSETVLTHLNSLAQQLMNTETQLYEKFREKRKGASDVKWLKNVLSSGTLSDKVAAHTLQVQESPVHSLVSLDWLMGLVVKGGGVGKAMKGLHAKRKGILATNTLKELWASELLPERRKLKYLNQRPLDRLSTSSSTGSLTHQQSTLLLLWFFEDQIKSRYVQFINTLQAATHDPSEEVREKMVGHVFDLLHQRPEQEKLLLTQLVNKLGDPHRKVASKAVMFILKLLNHHVNMKMVVTREIESLLHRPNISPKAQYYGVCCLNQLVLSPEDGPLVAKLMDVYFTFFKVYVQKESLDSKMLAALLSGVNRAFPFMTEELPSFETHLQSLFKVVHVGPVSTGIQALMLLHQVSESRHSVSDRYYNALYSKLMDPALKNTPTDKQCF
ncbi:CCAAT/enhancer-binding protein zeta [Geodia barretti]|nr:CCAAT/enhancer-binding protein zeta [Geodia barretti]